ncbi:MAG: hypothetical protein A2Z25_20700 [Planctomycetes bacterium RBG_16_55_9]|nr:MAG: hypothetical protein A2Z25_20700 [Planctomycetes bacterium RBG_16_55_9]
MAQRGMAVGYQIQSSNGTHIFIDAECIFIDSVTTLYEMRMINVGLLAADPASWKTAIVNAMIAAGIEAGFPDLNSSTIHLFDYEVGDRGDEYVAQLAAVWTKDITKTNIGSVFVNVYIGANGELQGVDFKGYKEYRFVVCVNKVGTGTQTAALVDNANSANLISLDDAGAAGEHMLDSGWTVCPAWATNTINLKPMAKSTITTDDPVYRQFALYLR